MLQVNEVFKILNIQLKSERCGQPKAYQQPTIVPRKRLSFIKLTQTVLFILICSMQVLIIN